MKRSSARWATAAGFFLAIGALGWIDYATGPYFGFSLFYLIPIAASAWLLGTAFGVATAVAAAVAWLVADFGSLPGGVAVYEWNAFTRLVTYVAVAYLVALVRKDRDRLAALNEQLAIALGTETDLARTDPLTNLANSRKFLEQLAAEMRNEERQICVAIVDIDNFKAVNDLHGHAGGDILLRCVAEVLGEATRSGDVVARMGGDEFAILFRRVSPEDAVRIGSRIVQRVRRTGEAWPGTEVGASVGIAWFHASPTTPQEVMQAADEAMYAAKAAGKGEIRVALGKPSLRRASVSVPAANE
jgi:diguanylate cyclase (GGDEF)-like protein